MLSAVAVLTLFSHAYAGERVEFGSVGHEMCHDLSSIADAKTPDEVQAAVQAVTDFPCPKNLPVRTFTCRPAIEAETNGIGHTHPSRVHPFLLRADPSNASLTVGDVAISTTDVLMDTSEDWQDIDFSTPWNGDSQIRDTQFELTKNAIGVWEFFDHLEMYICLQK